MSLVLRILQLCLARAQWAEVGQRLPIPLALVPPYLDAGVSTDDVSWRTGRIINRLTSAGFLWKPWLLAFHMG